MLVVLDPGRYLAHLLGINPNVDREDTQEPVVRLANGYELLRRIRELGDTPVIMLAASAGSAEIVRALRAGADDFMVKPIDMDVLCARIEAILRRARAGHPRPISGR